MDRYDTDLGGSSPMLVPSLGSGAARTPPLVGFGGKQGSNAYIVDRDRCRGRSPSDLHAAPTPRRTARCSRPERSRSSAGRDRSTSSAPYSDDAYNQADFGKARTTPAFFRDAGGTGHLFFSGSTKLAHGRREVVPPGLCGPTW
jgi:hypothetical protein